MTELYDDLLDEVANKYRDIYLLVEEKGLPIWLNLDLSIPQIRVLYTLSLGGITNVGRIATKLGVGISTTSHLVERLVRAGLVERLVDPDDRRRILVCLTPKGADIIRKVRSQTQERFRSWLAVLNKDDFAALQQGLRALMHTARIQEAFDE